MIRHRLSWVAAAMLPLLLLATPALAEDPPKVDSGDTAWMLASTALVLMMTIPGLALFYGGMVRKKNILAILMLCFVITCIVTIVWTVAGYSLAFTVGKGGLAPYVGDLSRFMLHASPTRSPMAPTPIRSSLTLASRMSPRSARRSPRPST